MILPRAITNTLRPRKIGELPPAATLIGDELIAVVQDGVLKHASAQNLTNLAASASAGYLQMQAFETVQPGQVVYAGAVDGYARRASASALPPSLIIGVAQTGAGPGFMFSVARDYLQLNDWTTIIGTQYLTPGGIYFLSTTPGMATQTPSYAVGSVISRLGVAVSADTLAIKPAAPILL